MLDYAVESWKGMRPYQEDCFGILDRGLQNSSARTAVYVIADGMGGHVGGAVASSLAVQAFLTGYASAAGSVRSALLAGLHAATEALIGRAASDPDLRTMGSTLLAVVLTDAGVEWLSVGDSPFWLVRDGVLRRLNADHSMKPVLDRMVETGKISREQAKVDPQRHQLRSALTVYPPELVDGSESAVTVEAGDALLLASDGILTLEDADIAAQFSPDREPGDVVRRILREINARATATQDNTTVLVIRPRRPSWRKP